MVYVSWTFEGVLYPIQYASYNRSFVTCNYHILHFYREATLSLEENLIKKPLMIHFFFILAIEYMSLCQLFDLCRNVSPTLLSLAQVVSENLTLIFSMEY